MPTPSELRGSGQESVRGVGQMSSLPDQAPEDRKKELKGKDVVYVATAEPFEFKAGARAKAKARTEEQPGSSSLMQPEVLQQSLMESNQQLMGGMTTVLAQAITPLVSGQQALLEMTQQSMNNQTLLMSTVQQTQGAMAQALSEMTQQIHRAQDEEEWDEVRDPPRFP